MLVICFIFKSKSEKESDKPEAKNLDPWSQAITTCNMSKIPKRKSKVSLYLLCFVLIPEMGGVGDRIVHSLSQFLICRKCAAMRFFMQIA